MTFLLQLLVALSDPLALFWLLLLAGALALLWKRRWLAGFVLVLFAALLSLIAGTSMPRRLVGSLEAPYVRESLTNLPACDAVVSLGGGHRFSRHDIFRFDLGEAGDRIVTALELVRQKRAPVLILGGGAYREQGGERGVALLLQNWFSAWNLPGVPVYTLGTSRNTHQEAESFRALAKDRGWKRILLVTSACHMRRAEGAFRTTGIEVVPVACDYRVEGITREPNGCFPIPSTGNLSNTQIYLHETIGWWLYWFRGWLAPAPAPAPTPPTPAPSHPTDTTVEWRRRGPPSQSLATASTKPATTG